ncbi:MAG: outer membrane protein assembly factor BamD [Pseudomonadota bacterium]
MILRNSLLIICISILCVGCKSKKDDDTIIPAKELYAKGVESFDKQKYKNAAEDFAKIYFQHPGSPLSARAEIMEAYSLYLAGEYDEATDVLDIFIKIHPLHEDIAYVYYLKALSYYMQISNSSHDQSKTEQAKIAFSDVISKFSGTKYAKDAALKMGLVNDHLAGAEMNIGRFYLAQNNPIAAGGRFEVVIRDYQTTSHAAEALYRMVESYMMLGLPEEAKKYAAVLGHNYPESSWYKRSFNLIK